MSQTTAPRREMVEGKPGQSAEPFGPEDVRTKVQPAGKSYFGRLVLEDNSGEDRVLHPAATIADLKTVMGIVASTHSIQSVDDTDDAHYPAQEAVKVARKGYMWVAITTDIALGDPVHALITATNEGKFANAGGEDLSSIMKWHRAGLAADGAALLELNLL